MADIFQLAEQLGKAISASPQAAALRTAREALNGKPEVTGLLKDYQQQANRIADLERTAKPVEVDDKHKLQDLHNQLAAAPAVKTLTVAQMEYVELMRKVSDTLRAETKDTDGPCTPRPATHHAIARKARPAL